MKKYNREAISVWASVDSTIMKNCRKTVRMNLSHSTCFVSKINRPHTFLFLNSLALSHFCQWQNSSMPYMFTVKRGLKLLLLYYTGLLPFVPLGESFLQFYLPQIINRSVYTNYFHTMLCARCIFTNFFLTENIYLKCGLWKADWSSF